MHKGAGAWKLLVDQFRNVLILTLLLATVVSGFLGHAVESVAIALIVLFSVLLGFLQEYRAERALQALRAMAAPNARVIREGKELIVPASQLVPGDIMLLAAGDRIPADGRLLEAVNLRVEEASLTGESLPSEKDAAGQLAAETSIGDRKNMVFSGTTAVYGRGKAVLTSTGMQSQSGQIARMLQEVRMEKTPLQKNLDRVGSVLARAALIMVFIIMVVGILRGQPFIEILIFGIALAVAVVPEALPAVVTISLALGVQKMARRHALVRSLPAVETLGSTTVICSDKTGTLTRDEMTVRALYAVGSMVRVSGSGYRIEGVFTGTDGRVTELSPVFLRLLEAGALCNDARLFAGDSGEWSKRGDPTEAALIVVARKAGVDDGALQRRYPRIAEEPFSSEKKRMVTLHRNGSLTTAFVKGAPEVLLSLCSSQLTEQGIVPLDGSAVDGVMNQAACMGSEALRVIAFAFRDGAGMELPDGDLVFLGLAGMIDPPRSEAAAAVSACRDAGIRPVMITGDHAVTASAIARELGILRDGVVLTGSELQEMDDAALRQAVGAVDVFARVSPGHKLRIVTALQERGEVVAMTGDGVNDAPALRKADIGISMGITGTDVAREASAMTLTDDNFASIVAAVEEGRGIYDNIRKYLTYLFSSNIGELGLMTAATLLALPLPLSAVQLLYVNLATDGLPALALAVDPAGPDIMRRPPDNPKQGIFTGQLLVLMLAGGAWSTLVNFALFQWALGSGRSVREAMTMTFVSLVLIQFFKAYNFRSVRHSLFTKPFANRWLNLAVLWELFMLTSVIYVPYFRQAFHTFPLTLFDWSVIVAGSMTVIPVIELVKWVTGKGFFGLKA